MLTLDDIKASFGIRLLQFFIDVAIIFVLQYTVFHFFPSGLSEYFSWILVFFLTLYFFATETVFSKTIGMMIMNIEVVFIQTEERINIRQSSLRTLGRVICTLTIGVGYALGLHDYLSETCVVVNQNTGSRTPQWTVFLLKHVRRLKGARQESKKPEANAMTVKKEEVNIDKKEPGVKSQESRAKTERSKNQEENQPTVQPPAVRSL